MPTVIRTQGNGIRYALECNQRELAFFSPPDARRVIKTGITAGGELFLVVFIPLRFNPSYAYKLGYQIGERWRKHKEKFMGKALPWIGETPPGGTGRNGEKMAVAVLKSRVQVPRTLDALLLVIPIGHPIQDKDTKAFHTILPAEVERISDEIHSTIESLITGAVPTTKGKHALTIEGATSRIPPARQHKEGPRRNVGGATTRARAA